MITLLGKTKNDMNWIYENREWAFSGIGVLAITLLIKLFIPSAKKPRMTQKSGANSVNIQAGDKVEVRDVRR
jgi:hypothetical protein